MTRFSEPSSFAGYAALISGALHIIHWRDYGAGILQIMAGCAAVWCKEYRGEPRDYMKDE